MNHRLRRVLRREALALGLAISLAGHLAFAHTLPSRSAAPSSNPRGEVELDFVELPPETPVASEPPPPEPTEAPTANAAAPTPSSPAVPAPPTAAPPRPAAEPAPETPLALAGVTLSGDDGGWSSQLGNGARMKGPIASARSGPHRPTAAAPAASAPNPAPGPREVALADLSERPRAPSLAGTLGRLYPPAARDQQISGHASVRVRVGPAGSVTSTQVVTESFPGFGAACRAALQGSTWSSPRDRKGRAVATWLLYRCNFALTR